MSAPRSFDLAAGRHYPAPPRPVALTSCTVVELGNGKRSYRLALSEAEAVELLAFVLDSATVAPKSVREIAGQLSRGIAIGGTP